MQVVPWDAEATVRKMKMVVHEIGLNFPWVKLVLFHELVVPGFASFVFRDTQNGRRGEVQPIPGPLTEALCDIARSEGRWLVPGSMHELADGGPYNTAIVISPGGEIVARYRKMFPWLPYERGTSSGSEFCVFDIPEAGRFGLCICYDMWFPEVARNLVWMGAEVILHPTLTPTSDRPLELVLSQANAIFNQCYFIDINGVSPFGGGQSILVDPNGRVLQQAGEHEAILTEILDLDLVSRTREYGTIGLSQTLKQLRDCSVQFPMYLDSKIKSGEGFRPLGPLKYHHNI
jgi:formamidase